jgi:hypothetical protein
MEKVPTTVLENATITLNAPFNNIGDGQFNYGSLLCALTKLSIDITYPKNNTAQLAAGHYLHVPFLVGSTENERDPFIIADELIQPGFVLPAVTRALADILTTVIRLLISLPRPQKYQSSENLSLSPGPVDVYRECDNCLPRSRSRGAYL